MRYFARFMDETVYDARMSAETYESIKETILETIDFSGEFSKFEVYSIDGQLEVRYDAGHLQIVNLPEGMKKDKRHLKGKVV